MPQPCEGRQAGSAGRFSRQPRTGLVIMCQLFDFLRQHRLSMANSSQTTVTIMARKLRRERTGQGFAAAHESVDGTKRTWRDVRLESVTRTKADID